MTVIVQTAADIPAAAIYAQRRSAGGFTVYLPGEALPGGAIPDAGRADADDDQGSRAIWFGRRFNQGVQLSPIVGTIRNNGTGADAFEYWKLIDYGGHAPIGVRKAGNDNAIETTASYIRVHHNVGGNITAGVISVLDESLAQTGLRIGTSVAEGHTDIYLYRSGFATISLSAGGVWSSTYQNAGITGLQWDDAAKCLVITHAAFANAGIVAAQQGSITGGYWQVVGSAVGSTETRLTFLKAQPEMPGRGTMFTVTWSSRSQVDPRSIRANEYPAGNIWILGWTGKV